MARLRGNPIIKSPKFERSRSDHEMKGAKEGSKVDLARDKKQFKSMRKTKA